MLRDENFGMRAIITAMNNWLNEFSQRDNFTLVRYEALRASQPEHFRDLLAALGEPSPDANIFQEALEFSRFETCKSSRPQELLTQTFYIRAMCAIQNRSRCAAEKLEGIANTCRRKTNNLPQLQ